MNECGQYNCNIQVKDLFCKKHLYHNKSMDEMNEIMRRQNGHPPKPVYRHLFWRLYIEIKIKLYE